VDEELGPDDRALPDAAPAGPQGAPCSVHAVSATAPSVVSSRLETVLRLAFVMKVVSAGCAQCADGPRAFQESQWNPPAAPITLFDAIPGRACSPEVTEAACAFESPPHTLQVTTRIDSTSWAKRPRRSG